MRKLSLALFSALLVSCTAAEEQPLYDIEQTIEIFETLASDEMEGRQAGTPGNAKARDYIIQQAEALGMLSRISVEEFEFEKPVRGERAADYSPEIITGYNIIGMIDVDDGDEGPLLVITAHYDHEGIRDGEVYNGADDNASGSAALFAIAQSFAAIPPEHDIMLVWLDAEEMRLQGARAIVRDNAQINSRPVFNLNLDMISQNESEIYLAGSYHYPELESLLSDIDDDLPITLSFGHDAPEDGSGDWTLQSDHAAFHVAGMPFAYIGVEDHPHYHKPTDRFETIPLEFYKASVELVVRSANTLDENLDDLAKRKFVEGE